MKYNMYLMWRRIASIKGLQWEIGSETVSKTFRSRSVFVKSLFLYVYYTRLVKSMRPTIQSIALFQLQDTCLVKYITIRFFRIVEAYVCSEFISTFDWLILEGSDWSGACSRMTSFMIICGLKSCWYSLHANLMSLLHGVVYWGVERLPGCSWACSIWSSNSLGCCTNEPGMVGFQIVLGFSFVFFMLSIL